MAFFGRAQRVIMMREKRVRKKRDTLPLYEKNPPTDVCLEKVYK
jgi:hypothetical protein